MPRITWEVVDEWLSDIEGYFDKRADITDVELPNEAMQYQVKIQEMREFIRKEKLSEDSSG